MYLRLGFAIAAHLDPDILLLDEVLAVGDAAFQSRCIERINQLRNAGRRSSLSLTILPRREFVQSRFPVAERRDISQGHRVM